MGRDEMLIESRYSWLVTKSILVDLVCYYLFQVYSILNVKSELKQIKIQESGNRGEALLSKEKHLSLIIKVSKFIFSVSKLVKS